MKILGFGLIAVSIVILGFVIVAENVAEPCFGNAYSPPEIDVEGTLQDLEAQLITDRLDQPTDMFVLPGSAALFVVEKPGRIVIVDDGTIRDQPLLDMASMVESSENEQGLLTALPHPDFAENCKVFLFYTDVDGDSRLVEARVSGIDQPTIGIGSFHTVMTIPQPHVWHQSGSMTFGPDGYLWITAGDGGHIGDPNNEGQNPKTLLATVMRIDVSESPYRIPPDNPFYGRDRGADEVWAYGVRNPWRIWIDDGNVYIPDAGQSTYEEIDVVPIDEPGHDFGWSVMEGFDCYDRDPDDGRRPTCDPSRYTMPVSGYFHEDTGCAIIGGPVYRGRDIPELDGHYFYADFCRGWIRSLVYEDGSVHDEVEWDALDQSLVTTFATDWTGEMYYANLDGSLWKIVPVRSG